MHVCFESWSLMKMKMKRGFLISYNQKIKFWLLAPMGKYYIMFYNVLLEVVWESLGVSGFRKRTKTKIDLINPLT
jgi:hypothetical protein